MLSFKKAMVLISITFLMAMSFSAWSEDVKNLPNSASNATEFLDVDEAFKVSLGDIKNSTLYLNFKIADGHYLYKKRIDVVALKQLSVDEIFFPKPNIKNDPNFGITEIYHDSFLLPVKFKYNIKQPIRAEIEVRYQGCSEKGLCYPPMVKAFTLDINASGMTEQKFIEPKKEGLGEGSALLNSGNYWLIVVGFFGLGLLLSLTPCVFPMIPILSGIIVGQANSTKGQAFKLSLAYTLGMAFSYTIAGIIAAVTGNMISAALQSPWVLGSFSVIFVALAMSMFGFYELQLPSSVGSNLTNYTNRLKGGRFAGVFVMGALSALIVSPCVAAPLAGALIYISKTHNIILGGSALFSLSMGMGVPLLVVGASAGVLLPKAGVWMEAVKNFFGVTMIGMAIWIITPIIPDYIILFMYALLIIISSIYLGCMEPLKENVSGWGKFKKGLGLVVFIIGVMLFIHAERTANFFSLGSENNASKSKVAEVGLTFKKVKNIEALNLELQNSKGSLVMLDFYADWCAACKEYEAITFKDPIVRNALKDLVLLQVDVTSNNEEDKQLMKKFELFGPPGIVFFDKAGSQIYKVIGYQNPEKFNVSINEAITPK